MFSPDIRWYLIQIQLHECFSLQTSKFFFNTFNISLMVSSYCKENFYQTSNMIRLNTIVVATQQRTGTKTSKCSSSIKQQICYYFTYIFSLKSYFPWVLPYLGCFLFCKFCKNKQKIKALSKGEPSEECALFWIKLIAWLAINGS